MNDYSSSRQQVNLAAPMLVAIAFVTLHLQVAAIGGFPITAGGAGLVLFILLSVRGLRLSVSVVACVLAILVAVGFAPIFNYFAIESSVEFWRTFLLLLSALVIFCLGVGGRFEPRTLRILGRGAGWALCAVSSMSVVQVLLGAAGSDVAFNPWGELQYLYQYRPYLEFNPIPRAGSIWSRRSMRS